MPQSACPIGDTFQAPLPKRPSYSLLSAMWHASCDHCHAPAQAVVTACHSLSGSPWQSPVEVSATMPSVQGGVLGKNEPLGNYPLEQILSSRWVRGCTSQAPRPRLHVPAWPPGSLLQASCLHSPTLQRLDIISGMWICSSYSFYSLSSYFKP